MTTTLVLLVVVTCLLALWSIVVAFGNQIKIEAGGKKAYNEGAMVWTWIIIAAAWVSWLYQ